MTEEDPPGVAPPFRLRRVLTMGTVALAAAVPAYLLTLILRSSRFSRYDYFQMVPSVVDANGSVIWSGLLDHQNEHLMVLPKLVYLVNIWTFAGSNVTLGLFVWTVALGLSVVLWLSLRRDFSARRGDVVLVVWMLAIYLFPLQAQHNFRLAMSGTAWILANLLAVAALALLVRHRPVLAAAAGGLATVTYGTGLAVWPAMAVVIILRRRFGRYEAVVTAVGIASILLHRVTADGGRAGFYDWSPINVGRSVAVTIGGLFADSPDLGMLIGLALVALAVASTIRLGARLTDDGPLTLVAIVVYTIGGLALFGVTRGIFGDGMLTAGRYMAFAALFVLAVSLLGLLAFPEGSAPRVVAATVAAASVFASVAEVQRFDSIVTQSDLDMVAVYMDAGVGVVPLYTEATDAAFRARGHVPFDGALGWDCGAYAGRLDPSLITRTGGPAGTVDGRTVPSTSSGFLQPAPVATVPVFEIVGTLAVGADVECIVVVGPSGLVTGIAISDGASTALVDAANPARGWTGYVDHDAPVGDVVVKLRGDERFYVIGQLPEP